MNERIIDGPTGLFIAGELKYAKEVSRVTDLLHSEAGVFSRWWPSIHTELVVASLPYAGKETMQRLRATYDAEITDKIYESAQNLMVIGNKSKRLVDGPTIRLIGEGINRDHIETVYYYGSESSLGHVAVLGLRELEIVEHPTDIYTYEQATEPAEAMK